MTEISATDTAPLSRLKRWMTPLLITAYVVAILMISGLSRARDEGNAASSIGETSSVLQSSLDDSEEAAESHR